MHPHAQQSNAKLVNLRHLRGSHLELVLQAQHAHWHERLAWDNSNAIDAIRRLLDQRRLAGLAVLVGGHPVGYSYVLHEGRKAAIGEVFLLPSERTPCLERELLETTILMASRNPAVELVGGQLLSMPVFPAVEIATPGTLRVYPRQLMIRERQAALPVPRRSNPCMRFLPWTDLQLPAASELIQRAYAGHVDASLSPEYRSVPGARRFLEQTINRGSSGRFLAAAGFVARQASSPGIGGICLGSMVGDRVGHILQLCVAPEWSSAGIGSGLLQRSLDGFTRAGCDAVSLTVTASNERAVRIYERFGFRILARFPSFVWRPA